MLYRQFVKFFLKRVREFVSLEGLDIKRLPKWVKYANVNIAKLNNSIIFLFEDSTQKKDTFCEYGNVNSDLQFFINLPPYRPKTASFKAPNSYETGLIIFHGQYNSEGKVIFNILSPNSALFNIGYIPYHSPIALLNLFIQSSYQENILSIRFIPFALYIHEKDYDDFESSWNKFTPHLQNALIHLHNSDAGDYYEITEQKQKSILTYKEKSVIIYGKYGSSEESELITVRDYLRSKNYEAYLLKELPEDPSMTLEQKVILYAVASRFNVMIDRTPSGHLVEYHAIKNVPAILSILRQRGKGSTFMIDYGEISMNKYIELFEFNEAPMEVIDEAIKLNFIPHTHTRIRRRGTRRTNDGVRGTTDGEHSDEVPGRAQTIIYYYIICVRSLC